MRVLRAAFVFTASVALLTAVRVVAAAPLPPPTPVEIATPPDVFEPLNRLMFRFNIFVVDYAVDPTAAVLESVTPVFVRQIAGNVYENLSELEFVFTNLVAGYPTDAAVSAGRFVTNSTIGLAGLFDVATPLGLRRRMTEVSEATCKAGIPPGPYLVLPLVGSTNLYSGGVVAVLVVAEWSTLGLISSTLAAGDAVVDVAVSLASLRHLRDIPQARDGDLYALQQDAFWTVVKAECGPA